MPSLALLRGHVILDSERNVAVDPRKVAAVAEWATVTVMPQSCTDVCRFVGLANYYRKFVLSFSALAAPLTALCSLRALFAWGDTEQRSFDTLKAFACVTRRAPHLETAESLDMVYT